MFNWFSSIWFIVCLHSVCFQRNNNYIIFDQKKSDVINMIKSKFYLSKIIKYQEIWVTRAKKSFLLYALWIVSRLYIRSFKVNTQSQFFCVFFTHKLRDHIIREKLEQEKLVTCYAVSNKIVISGWKVMYLR